MIGVEDAPHTLEYDHFFKILPAINDWSNDPARIKNGVRVKSDFAYRSDTNTEWMTIDALRRWLAKNQAVLGRI